MANGQTRSRIKQKVKSHIPKDWLTDVRILYRMLIETFKGIQQTGLINIAIITTMAAILTIFGALFRSSLSLQSIVNELGGTLQISAYLSDSANSDAVISRIKKIEHVKEVKFISKQKAWAELKNEIDVPDVENPLPDTLHVKVDMVDNLDDVLVRVKHVDGVSDTGYAKDWVKKFQTLNKVSHTVTFLVVIIACLLTITIINNTIQLVIQSRKEEIEIMRLMGVSNWYIKFPLVLQGAIYGFLGAIIAIFPINIVQNYLYKVHEFFMIPSFFFAQQIVILSVLAVGILFSAGGSLMCIKKHLKV
ncbi:TPA: ABC transporter permease [Candidatus Galligastranaerophilus intestinigallinarum]|nr:ABC transporter permease [Candidatus Galligastranaerophilus intestinigallinarum]